jgi:hypothetical protein
MKWEGTPRKPADCWHLSKGTRSAICVLFNHPFGWELRVTVDHELVRSEVFRESDPTITAAVEWRSAFERRVGVSAAATVELQILKV